VDIDRDYPELAKLKADPDLIACGTSRACLPFLVSEQLRLYNQTLALIQEARGRPQIRGRLVGQACKIAESIRKLRWDLVKQAGGQGIPTVVTVASPGEPVTIRRDENGLRIVQ
jgi:hypothetical protein